MIIISFIGIVRQSGVWATGPISSSCLYRPAIWRWDFPISRVTANQNSFFVRDYIGELTEIILAWSNTCELVS